MPVKRYQVDCPHAALKKQWSFLAEQQLSSLSFVLDYDLVAYYQQPQVIIPLTVFCCLYSDGRSRCMVTTRERFGDIDFLSRSVDESAMLLEEAAFDLNLPLMLEPVHIPKPWGQEIWFTGIEARGQASICSASGKTLLPYVLPLFQPIDQLSSPVLLKVLDPSSEPVYGDLYFELHTRKQEVYVVTHVDHQAWPKGEGAIRFGFCKKKRSLYASDEDFKAAYLEAVQSYRAVRQQIDVYYDELKLSTGLALNEPVPLETLKAWVETLPAETQTLERQLREEMHSFTGMQSLAVGDVLAVPCLVPHALQHGVRTVEFQTPVYERKILSFAQKVLTQSDWDTGEALSLCDIHLPAIAPPKVIKEEAGVCIDRIVDFEGFQVDRMRMKDTASYRLTMTGGQVLMVVSGELVFAGNCRLKAEQAMMIPMKGGVLALLASGETCFLLATPV